MTVKSTLFAAALLAWLFFGLAQAHAETVSFGANESPPYWSAQQSGHGLCGEILQAISQAAGLESIIEFKPLKRLIEDDGNNDLGNPAFYLERQSYAAIIPIAITQAAFFYYLPHHPQGIVLQSLEDLKSYRIGILKGALTDDSFLAKAGLRFEPSYTQASPLKKLKLQRIDLYFELDLVGRQAIATVFPGGSEDFAVIAVARSAEPIAIMLGKDQPNAGALGERYRVGLERIIADGSYQRILESYYGKDRVPVNWYGELIKFQQLYAFRGGK